MNVRLIFPQLALLLGASLVLPSADAQAQRTAPPFDWNGRLAPGQTLEIKAVNGDIHATSGNGGVRALRSSRRGDPNDVEIVVVEHSGGVTICAVPPSRSGRVNECRPGEEGSLSSNRNEVRVEFDVQMPAGVDFVARNANGSIEADGLDGEVLALSSNGSIRIDGASAIRARTVNGSIDIRSTGEADARTTNGKIRAEMGRVGSSGDPLEFSTTNGTVTLVVPSGINADLDARTVNGRINSEIPISMTSTSRRSVRGQLGTGGRRIEVRSTNGSVVIERGA